MRVTAGVQLVRAVQRAAVVVVPWPRVALSLQHLRAASERVSVLAVSVGRQIEQAQREKKQAEEVWRSRYSLLRAPSVVACSA